MTMGVSSTLKFTGQLLNEVISFLVFSALDLLDVILCIVFKIVDYIKESEWKPCYCSSNSTKDMLTSNDKILVSELGGSKIVCLRSSSKLQLEDISDTLYSRSSLVSDVFRNGMLKMVQSGCSKSNNVAKRTTVETTFTINSTIVQMLQGRIEGQQSHPMPRWSDCDCKVCTSWMIGSGKSLYVHAQIPLEHTPKEDVLFIHGFISSSSFWTETVFPNFTNETKSKYRLIAVDLLGFGRSPKPMDSLYTLREHVEMIERVVESYQMKSFHVVAHSLGSILALALASKYPDSIKSLTLLAPPYFPVPKGEQGSQYVLRQVAPRRVWPPLAFGASLACWYEHISRTICLVISKNHRLWEYLFKLITRNRIKTFLIEGFFCHTHNAAWHTVHNIICGSADKIDGYINSVRDHLTCKVTIIHGRDDEVLPIDCSIAVKSKIPRADIRIIDDKDHITVIVGRQKEFARELEEIWLNADS